MRILIDSSVWIDFFRGVQNSQTSKLKESIRQQHDIYTCGFVETEVLQGFPLEADHRRARLMFASLEYLQDERSTFELAATIYRELRRSGVTVRATMDCLISAIVVQHGVHLLQNDRDFQHIDKHYPLNLL